MAVLKYYDGSDWEPVVSALQGPTGPTGAASTITGPTGATGPTGSAAASKVVQIVYASTTTETSSSSSTYADTGLSASITPTSASNKVLVMVTHGSNQKDSSNTSMGMRLFRGATNISQIIVDGGKNGTSDRQDFGGTSINYLDEPATTSATTYKTQFNSQNNSNYTWVQVGGGRSTMILIEVTP
jgi:hypothetical protein